VGVRLNFGTFTEPLSSPPRAGSYPTVPSNTGEWSLNPSSHSLDWSIAQVNADDRSGSLEFSVGGDDAGAFFPVKVSFVAQGSLAGVSIASVDLVDGGAVTFSQEATVSIENYVVSG
jgi:coatomer subunit delta